MTVERDALLLRAMQEDHGAQMAASEEARRAHRGMAEQLRARAERLRRHDRESS